MLFSRGRGPIFAWVCRACRRCSTRRRSRNCWRFWACRCIWRCMGSFVEWRGCWSRWPCTIPAWVFLWTFMPGPLWWRLPASRPGALPCRPWRRRPRLVATSVRSFRLSSPSVILYSTILIRHREEFRIYEKDRLEKKETDWKKDMGKGWTGMLWFYWFFDWYKWLSEGLVSLNWYVNHSFIIRNNHWIILKTFFKVKNSTIFLIYFLE